jgi:glutamate-1-semialdehyde aminotransferase
MYGFPKTVVVLTLVCCYVSGSTHTSPKCPDGFVFLHFTMPSNKRISDEAKKHVIHLRYNRHRKQADITKDLRISISAVEKILGEVKAVLEDRF